MGLFTRQKTDLEERPLLEDSEVWLGDRLYGNGSGFDISSATMRIRAGRQAGAKFPNGYMKREMKEVTSAKEQIMEGERCQSCQIVTGGEEEPWGLTDYRGQRICYWCIKSWKHREKIAGRKITFDELKSGKLKRRHRNT